MPVRLSNKEMSKGARPFACWMGGMRIPYLFVFLGTCCLCFGQSISVGVKGGVRATGDIGSNNLSAISESKRYIVGPMLEVGLPFGIGVEADALYRRNGYRTDRANFAGGFSGRERANSWEFPLLLKYKLPIPLVKPYVAGGVAARTMSGFIDSTGYAIDFLTGKRTFSSSGHADAKLSNSVGFVAGGGVQFGLGKLRISPEVRYTYWNNTPVNEQGSQGYGFQSSQNQVDVLVGVTWKVF